jgi:hypothetical protein
MSDDKKRTMGEHVARLRSLAKSRKKSDPEVSEMLLWAADMIEVHAALVIATSRERPKDGEAEG